MTANAFPAGVAGELPEPLPEEEQRRLLIQASEDDDTARERVVRHNLRLVWHCVNRLQRAWLDEDELFQWGCVGLLEAVDRFDPARGTRFSTYAVPRILGEMRRRLRDKPLLRVSRRRQRLALEAQRLRAEIQRDTGREPDIAELARRLDTDASELAAALAAVEAPLSLDHPLQDEASSATLHDLVEDPQADQWLADLYLQEAMERLPERQQEILRLRLSQGLTQAETGGKLGLSQSQISRMEQRALRRLRRMLRS